MKNILKVGSDHPLNARQLESLTLVCDADVKNKEILDIGCGFGWCELAFLKRKAKLIVGTEISEEDLEAARKGVDDERVKFIVGNATKLPFPSQAFDTVVSWEVIEHIPRSLEDQMFSEINRVLKPGGVFYMSTPFDSLFSKVLDPAWWLIGHRHYSLEQLTEFGNDHGFEVVTSRTKGRIWGLLSMNNMYIAKWVFRRKSFLENFFSRKESTEYRAEGYANIFIKFRKTNDVKTGLLSN